MINIILLNTFGAEQRALAPLLHGICPGTQNSSRDVFEINNEGVAIIELNDGDFGFQASWYNPQALLYHVDLNQKLIKKNLQSDLQHIKKFKEQHPNAKVILVGTYDNPVDKNALSEAQNTLDYPFDHAAAVSINVPKLGAGNFVENLRQAVLTPLYQAQSHKKVQPVALPYSEPLKPFPTSYSKLWARGEDKFSSALEILRDYSKSNPPDTYSFFGSKVKLAVTSHLFRHHTDVVEALYKKYYNTKQTPIAALIDELKTELIKKGEDLKSDGSLAQRIRFIEKNVGLEPTDFKELQQNITEARSARAENVPLNI